MRKKEFKLNRLDDYIKFFIKEKYILKDNSNFVINFVSNNNSIPCRLMHTNKKQYDLEYAEKEIIDVKKLPVNSIKIIKRDPILNKEELIRVNIDTLENPSDDSIRYFITPKQINLKYSIKNCPIEKYRTHKFYGPGEYCLYGQRLYKCLRSANRGGKFNKSYWQQIDANNINELTLLFICEKLNKRYTDSFLYDLNIIPSGIYATLCRYHNTIMSKTKYEQALEYITAHKKELVAKYNLPDLDSDKMLEKIIEYVAGSKTRKHCNIKKSEMSDTYYIIEFH